MVSSEDLATRVMDRFTAGLQMIFNEDVILQ